LVHSRHHFHGASFAELCGLGMERLCFVQGLALRQQGGLNEVALFCSYGVQFRSGAE